MDIRNLVGNNIKFHRFKQNMTQEMVSDLTKISTNSISNIENGKADARLSTLEKIANALGIEIITLFDKQEHDVSKWRVDLKNK